MKLLYILVILALVFSIAGCRRSEEETARTTQQPTGAPATGAGAGGSSTHVSVELGEWYVKTEPASVPAGNVHFAIKNVGNNLHAFEIEGQGVEERSKDLRTGQTDDMAVQLRPGTYTVYCPIGSHEERGMKAQFTVTAPQNR